MQAILVVVVNHSQFELVIQNIHLKNSIIFKETFESFNVSGSDAKQFLHGQLSNDVKKMSPGEFAISSRLDRSGRIQSFFYLLYIGNSFEVLCRPGISSAIITDLEKYVIMEEVEFSDPVEKSFCFATYNKKAVDNSNYYLGSIGPLRGVFYQEVNEVFPIIDSSDVEKIKLLAGVPVWKINISPGQLVNETVLLDQAIDFDKGCYLGQETVSKIESRKGAASKTVLFFTQSPIESLEKRDLLFEGENIGKVLQIASFNQGSFLQCQIKREYLVFNKLYKYELDGQELEGELRQLPFIKKFSPYETAMGLYKEGVLNFQAGEVSKALELLNNAIEVDPGFSDAYETIGVILGQQEKYREALSWMDQLLEVDPNSVMAHTNKSLFFMKLGDIERAEEEKSLATVKTFEQLGREAKEKREKEDEISQEKAQLDQRFKMFQEVLKIDSGDMMASVGLAEILYKREEYKTAWEQLRELKSQEDFTPQYYLIVGKCLIKLTQSSLAKEMLEKGVRLALKLGQNKHANEMQFLLNQI
jgi:folate-binding protein YgfZ